MRTTSLLKRIVDRWQHRAGLTDAAGSSDRGDTLVEVLLAMVILGIASVALLAGFATSIAASAEHRNIAALDSSTRIAANQAIADVQQQAAAAEATPTDPFTCQNEFIPSFSNLTGFTVQTTPQYWVPSQSQFVSDLTNCSAYQPQQYTMTVTSTASASYSTSVSTVVSDPSAPPTPNVGSATQLAWLIQPGGGTAGTPIAPQPEVAVEDGSGYIVQNDFSSVTLVATRITGTGNLSNTCFGAESYGIVQFSGCSFSAGGTYSISASDGTLTPPQQAVTVTISNAPPAKLAVTSTALSGTANNKATLGPVTVTLEDAFGNPVNSTGATTVTLGSTSAGATFATTSGGTSVGSVAIASGQSTATFYYGDTVAGSPTLTVSASGMASGTQAETINAGTATKIGFTNSPVTAGASAPAANSALTVAVEDTYGNPTTKTTSTALTLTSNSKGTYIFNTTQSAKTPTGSNSTISIAANKTSVSFYYGDSATGSSVVTATTTSLGSATQTETITTAPAKLVFTTPAVTGNAYTDANLGPITVTEETSAGVPTTVGETVNLSSNSSGPYIFSATQGATTPAGNTSLTIPNGSSSVTFYYGDSNNGSPTITAAATGLTSATQVETINVGPLASFALSTPSTSATAGTAFTETITAQDAGGNTIPSDNGVTCLIFNGPDNSPTNVAPLYPAQGTCPSGSSVTFTNGVATASVTLYDAETTALSATAGFVTGSSSTFTVIGAAAATFVLATPSPTAGTSFSEIVTATDTYGNTATSYGGTAGAAKCVTFSGPSKSPNNTSPAYPAKGACATGVSSVTFTSGVGLATITLYDAQTTALTATASTINGTTASFTVGTASLSSLSVANPGAQVAGQQFNVSATGTDAYGNGYSGILNPTFSGPASSPNGTAPLYPSSVTFANGSATIPVTLYDAQTTTLTVTSGVHGVSPSFTVSAAPSNGFSLSTPTPTAGTAFNETIKAGDAFGNVITSLTGAQCITFSGPTSSPGGTAPLYPAQGSCGTGASSVTFSGGSGTASIKLYNAQTTTLTAATSSLSGTSASFTVATGPATVFALPTTPGPQTAGTAFGLTVRATDTYGNGYTGTLTSGANGLAFSGPSTSPSPASTPPSYPTSLTFAAGVATASVTLFDAQTTTIKVAATGVTSATSGSFTVSAATASQLTATSGANQSATINAAFASPLVATATDSYSNAVSNVSVTFAAPASGASASFAGTCASNQLPYSCTQTTGSNGQATSSALTANGTSGNYSIAATASGLTTATYSEANNKANQTISYTSTAPSATVGGSTYTPSASATSGLAVTIAVASTSTSICSISGGVVSFQAVGTCTLNANQAGNTNYNAATQVQQTVTVGKGSQTISYTSSAPSATVGGSTYTPTATSTSGLAVTITVASTSSSICSISSGTVSFQAVGTCTLNANQAGNTNYNAATQVQQTVTVGKGSQTISYTSTAPTSATVGGSTYTPSASATSGLTVTITVASTSSSICSISSGTVSFQAVGTCTLNANQAGNTNYDAATQVQQTVTVFGSPTAVALASGSGTVGAGDSATVTFNDALQPSTICSTWTGSGTKSVTNAIITFTNSGNNDYFTATSSSCSGSGNFGTVYSGSSYVSGTVTFSGSTISWNPTTNKLTFTLGSTVGGSNKISTRVTAGFPGYATDSSVTDTSGNAISTTTFTSSTKTGF